MAAPERSKGRNVAAACAAAALICLPLTKVSEGSRLKPYRDPANIVTWCYGETNGTPKSRYTQGECETLLENRLARDYAPKIAACLPQVTGENRIAVFGALLDAGYNTGPGAVCKSPMAAAVRRNDIAGACRSFRGWYVTARYTGKPQAPAVMRAHSWTWTGKNWRKELPGLVARRVNEARMCEEGL